MSYMPREGSDKPRIVTLTGEGEVMAGRHPKLDNFHVEDQGILARVAADHIFREEYDDGEVEFLDETLRIRIPHEYSNGKLTHDYLVDDEGNVYARHSLPTSEKDFTDDSADAMHHHITEKEFKRLVARANKVSWFADEIIDIHERNPQVAEDILKEYRWGPVLDPKNLARNITALHTDDGGPEVLGEALAARGFGSTDYMLGDSYEIAYEELLERAVAGENTGSLDFEEGTKGRSLQDFYMDTKYGREMRRIYWKEINRVISKVARETDIDLETL